MAVKTLGTSATDSLTSLTFAGGIGGMNFADLATIANRIRDDKNVAHPVIPASFTPAGLLYVPRRGVLKILPGDYVAIDSQGWPILVSARSIANGPWGVNRSFTPFTADFVNGVYTKSGALATVADVFVQDQGFWGTYNPAACIVHGTGLVSDDVSGNESAPALAPDLVNGYVAAGGTATFVMTFTVGANNNGSVQAIAVCSDFSSNPYLEIGSGTGLTFFGGQSNSDSQAGFANNSSHKVAFTMAADHISFSFDGGAVTRYVMAFPIAAPVAAIGIDAGRNTDVIKTFSMQATVADSALPALSV